MIRQWVPKVQGPRVTSEGGILQAVLVQIVMVKVKVASLGGIGLVWVD